MDMERLTREETIVVRGKEMAACNYENDDCNDSCRYGRCRWQEKANILLKEYEDTGLTPPEIMELKERNTPKEALYEIYGDQGCGDEPDAWICPNCEVVYDVDDDYDFCPDCGQMILR